MKINRTTQRTIEILKLVSKAPEGLSLDEICDKLTLPKTSGYDIVTTLAAMGMINVSRGERQKYSIGLAAYRIGISYTNNMDFISILEPKLRAFAKEVERTVFFGIPSDSEIVYICKYEPDNPIITTATVGTKNPMYCTSLGKAILAAMKDEEREQAISRIRYTRRTERTICSEQELLEELAKIRQTGYATDYREMEEHMVCVGAAVYGSDGSVMGAISASSLYREHDDYGALGRKVKEKADELSRLLGYMEHQDNL